MSKNLQNLIIAYKSTLGLQAAGGDVRAGSVAVAEGPVVSRRCQDATAATHDFVAAASRWVVCRRWWWATTAGEEHQTCRPGYWVFDC